MEPRDKINRAIDGLTYKQAAYQLLSAIERLAASTDDPAVSEVLGEMLVESGAHIQEKAEWKRLLT